MRIVAMAVGMMATTVLSGAAWSQCTGGESRCGAGGYVERCSYADHDWRLTEIKCQGHRGGHHADGDYGSGQPCTGGESRCGADGRVERCSYADKDWRQTDVKCKR